MPYQPIENYGLIGNLRTAAFVGMDGSIDWLCLPNFDSPSVFAAILDDRVGGRFKISPVGDGFRLKQHYWPNTNILITRFLHPRGVGEITDYMPVNNGSHPPADQVVRRVRVVHGEMQFRVHCQPAFDYARATHDVYVEGLTVRFDSSSLSLALASTVPLHCTDYAATAEFVLSEGQDATFVLRCAEPGQQIANCPNAAATEIQFRETIQYWQNWLSHCTYHGRWREQVHRSALVLKLLTYQPTGALIAAPTTSLPEGIGGVRNWDYRYTWLRDASFVLYALMRIGFTEEAGHFMDWLAARWSESHSHSDAPRQLMYGIDGRDDLPEIELTHLEGYRGSRPVRIGNAAHGQLQLDIYGELMDAVYLHNKYGTPVGYDRWTGLRRLIDWVCENWDRPDEGIWEVRGGQRHFVFSRMMCWVAIDRGIRLADKRSLPTDRARWLQTRDAIYEEVMKRGWDPQREAFTQSYGSPALDASTLLMPLVFFTSPNDPRMLATIDAIRSPLSRGGLAAGSLVYRYVPEEAPDGLPGNEGTFNMCSFWLVEALTRAGRSDRTRLNDARLLFEELLGYSNHLGLYAEQTGPSGEALGNYPQAFTHLALISAAFNLDRALGNGRQA